MSKWIIKDDMVVVIAGNDKGKAGKVLSKKKDKVIIQGINMRKKHIKKTQKTQTAQIVEMEMPIHISNVGLCDKNNKPIKVRVKEQDKEKKLIYFENDKEIVLRMLKAKVKG